MNLNSSLTNELRDKDYRHAYVASQIRIGVPFQIRGLRKSLNLNQDEFAALVGMTQPRISELEKPGARNLNIDTLLRVASGADVAVQVRFLPFSELMEWSERFDPDTFHISSFDQEIQDLEKREASRAANAGINAVGALYAGLFDNLFKVTDVANAASILGIWDTVSARESGLKAENPKSAGEASMPPASVSQPTPVVDIAKWKQLKRDRHQRLREERRANARRRA